MRAASSSRSAFGIRLPEGLFGLATRVSAAPAAASLSTGRWYESPKGTSTVGASWMRASVRYST